MDILETINVILWEINNHLSPIVHFLDRNYILFASLVGIIPLYLLYRRAKAADQNAKAAIENTKIAHQGLTTERLTRAIEQLANDKVHVRMGGVLGLQQIGLTENINEDERRKIAHILVSFIRERAVKKSEISEYGPDLPEHVGVAVVTPRKGLTIETRNSNRNARMDVEAAVNALADIASSLTYRENPDEFKERKHHLCDLRNMDLRDLRFVKADLSFFDFENTDFSGAWLRGTNFNDAQLDLADFNGAWVHGATFKNANISHTKFTTAKYLTQRQVSEAFCVIGYPPFLPQKPPPDSPEGWQLPPDKDRPIDDGKPGEYPDDELWYDKE